MVWVICGVALYVAIGAIVLGMVVEDSTRTGLMWFVVLAWPLLLFVGIGLALRGEE